MSCTAGKVSSSGGTLWSRLRGLHRSSKNAVNGKGTLFDDPKNAPQTFKTEIKFLFYFIKKRHPTKMKYGTYGFY
jgi:hypothetical protein